MSDKDTKLPSSTSAFSFGSGGGASPCGCQGNQGLGALDARPTLAAPRCPIRFCLRGPPLRSHMEHENFLQISHLTLATDQTISWKTTKVYRPNGAMRTVGEKTSKITLCFKKSAIFPPWTSLDRANFRMIHLSFPFVFSKQNCNNTETNNCCLKNSFMSLFLLIFILKSIGSDIIGQSDHSHYWSLETHDNDCLFCLGKASIVAENYTTDSLHNTPQKHDYLFCFIFLKKANLKLKFYRALCKNEPTFRASLPQYYQVLCTHCWK